MMTLFQGSFRLAAPLILLIAVFHTVAPFLGSFASGTLIHFVVAVIYAVIAFCLIRDMRGLGYVAFVGVFVGASVAMTGIWALGAVPGALYVAITVANLLAAVALFAALWRSPTIQPG